MPVKGKKKQNVICAKQLRKRGREKERDTEIERQKERDREKDERTIKGTLNFE